MKLLAIFLSHELTFVSRSPAIAVDDRSAHPGWVIYQGWSRLLQGHIRTSSTAMGPNWSSDDHERSAKRLLQEMAMESYPRRSRLRSLHPLVQQCVPPDDEALNSCVPLSSDLQEFVEKCRICRV